MIKTAKKYSTTPIASASGCAQELPLNKPIQNVRRDYQGLPADGYVRVNQLVRNPKRPCIPALIPVTRVTLWRWVAAGVFPAPVKLSGGVTAWHVSDVRRWLDQQQAKTEADHAVS